MSKVTPVSNTPHVTDLRTYYIRDFRSDVLSDAMTFAHANLKAREISRTNSSGLQEIVTYFEGNLHIVATYLRGKKRYQGMRSRQAAMYNLPPTL